MTFQPKINANLETAYEYIILIIIEERAFLPRLNFFCNWSAVSSFFPVYVWMKRTFYNAFMFPYPPISLQSKTEKLLCFFFLFLYINVIVCSLLPGIGRL